ncbi:hypothetical protein, partial [Streptomyces sp. NPDC001657]
MAGTTALAAAVIGGLLGGVPSAQAAPADPAVGSPDQPDRPAGAGQLPAVWPRPQSLRELGDPVPLGDAAVVVAAPDTDPYALDVVRGLLRDAG